MIIREKFATLYKERWQKYKADFYTANPTTGRMEHLAQSLACSLSYDIESRLSDIINSNLSDEKSYPQSLYHIDFGWKLSYYDEDFCRFTMTFDTNSDCKTFVANIAYGELQSNNLPDSMTIDNYFYDLLLSALRIELSSMHITLIPSNSSEYPYRCITQL